MLKGQALGRFRTTDLRAKKKMFLQGNGKRTNGMRQADDSHGNLGRRTTVKDHGGE